MTLPMLLALLAATSCVLAVSLFARRRSDAAPVASAAACEQGVISALLSRPEALAELKLDGREKRMGDDPEQLEPAQFTSSVHAQAFALIRAGQQTPEALCAGLQDAGVDPVVARAVSQPLSDDLLAQIEHLDSLSESEQRQYLDGLPTPGGPDLVFAEGRYARSLMRESYASSLHHRRLRPELDAATSLALGFAEAVYSESVVRPADSVTVTAEVQQDHVQVRPAWNVVRQSPVRMFLYLALGAGFGYLAAVNQVGFNGFDSLNTVSIVVLATVVMLIAGSGALISEVDLRSYIIDDPAAIALYAGTTILAVHSFIVHGWMGVAAAVVTAVGVLGAIQAMAWVVSRRVGRSALGLGDTILLPAVVMIPALLHNWRVDPAFMSTALQFWSTLLISLMAATLTIVGGLTPALLIGLTRLGFRKAFALGPYLILGIPVGLALSLVPAIAKWLSV
jgi:hypothetical protein